ncbi:hypothetical protein N7456_010847 [Penicillium angulare]|uniref:Uncharacterized protein n=1 Tax=Penicillium angulare TaxID=116970 RepID=A0A9W9ESN9_9EURO|nr:hypothetical protein N7456_010847 [Penicillium angulare]
MNESTPQSRNRHGSAPDEQNKLLVERLEDDEQSESIVDRASNTRHGCIGAIVVGMVLSFLCLISGTYMLVVKKKRLGAPISLSTPGQEALSLAINLVLALCTDGMMFVHSASLRWELYREHRLEFNTNIRLFTSSKKFGPNKWYINVIALVCLILSYAASSVLFVTLVNDEELGHSIMINATALVALGLGLVGQALIGIWCLVASHKHILTWSSNPLNSALVLLQSGDLTPRPGRCMQPVHQRHAPAQPAYPTKAQGSIFRANRTVRYILGIIWAMALLAIAWPIALVLFLKVDADKAKSWDVVEEAKCFEFGFNWSPVTYGCHINEVLLALSPDLNNGNKYNTDYSYGTQLILCLLFVCLVQGGQTIVLHCLELLVNLSRDEAIWRQAYNESKKASGTQRSTNPFYAAVSSWENIILFIAKAVMHWIIGQSLLTVFEWYDPTEYLYESVSLIPYYHYGIYFYMIYSRLFIYAILAVFLAAFGTYLALKQPQGCQPAALGHLQTLVDLIDDWKTNEDGRMWWGDKTGSEDSVVRHAGTCCGEHELGPIHMEKYAGGQVAVVSLRTYITDSSV